MKTLLRACSLLRACALAALAAFAWLTLAATPAAAEIIGVEAFHYPDGAIAGRSGGTFWDFKNVAPTSHTGTASTWDNISASPVVAAARLLTNNNSAKREYNGANESQGAVNDANVNKVVYYRATFTTGATLPDFCVLSSYDGAAERLFFGKLFGEANFTLGINDGSTNTRSNLPVLPNTTYTLVVKIDFSGNTLSLFVNPDLNFAEPDPLISRAFPNVEPSTAVRLASGFAGDAVAWDNLVVATSWDDLGTVVTTAVDEDNGPSNPVSGAGYSLREAVNHSPAGSLITFAPALSGQTCNLTGLELVINRALTIDGPGADLLTVRRAENAASDFRIFNITHPLAIGGLTIAGGRATSAASNGSFGGGIFSRSTLVLTGVHLTDNRASADGGGVGLAFANGTFMGCTFSGNTAGGSGGGINFRDNNTGSTLRLVNSTVSGNRATTRGGGVHHASTGGASTLEVLHCTIFNNTGGGLASFTEASGSTTTATTTLRNSIVATNAPTNLARGATAGGPSGTFTSLNFNLSDNYNGALTTQAQDRTDAPRLAPLALIGGPTPAHALFANSPALDAGNATGATTDQRGLARLFNALGAGAVSDGADIGAVEMRPLFVENAADTGTGSLRAAVTVANSNGAALDDILFRGTLFDTPQTIELATALPNLGSVALHGPAANLLTVRRAANGVTDFRVFTVTTGVPGGVALGGLTIAGGRLVSGGNGGGISSDGSNLTLTGVHLTGNQSAGLGGGVLLANADGTFTGCTFSGNTALEGGGIHYQAGGGRTLRVINCTVSGNQATSGGGINNSSTNGRLEIISSTIAQNTAPNGGGILTVANAGGNTATATLRNSIIAQNTPTNLLTFGAGNPTVTSRGFNLSNDYNGFLSATTASDLTTPTPRLAPLSLIGGTLPTHALLGGSPALDAGQSSGATTDQRGQARVFDIPGTGPATGGDHADIGAVEMRPLFVNSIADNGAGTLRQAIIDANGNGASTLDDILFTSTFDTAQTIALAGALPDIATSVALHGPAANLLTVRRLALAADFRIFTVAGGVPGGAAFSGMTIAGGRATGSGNDASGGGIFSASPLALTQVHLTGNTASVGGGGVLLFVEGTFTGCTISGNAASQGAGIQYQGDGGRTLRLVNSTVSGNQASNGGGGILHFSLNFSRSTRLEITGSTIAQNTAADGGGVYTVANAGNTATTTFRNSIIAQNTPTNLVKDGDGTTTVASRGFNLANDGGGGFLTALGDKTNTPAGLDALLANGGPTPTHALRSGSAALDAGSNAGSGVTSDGRGAGFPRPVDLPPANATGGDGADIGAFEAQSTPPLPTLSIGDRLAAEGNAGSSPFDFVVTLSAPSGQPVTVSYGTADGTASAGSDYAALGATTLTFAPGETLKTVSVTVFGDGAVEGDETFSVVLSAPSGATIADGTGLGTIQNEDVAQTFNVSSTADDGPGSLRQALADANANPAPDTIAFAAPFNAPQTIALAAALPTITGSVTLTGPGAHLLTVRRADNAATDFRIFTVAANLPGPVTLSGLTIAGGRTTGSGGGIFAQSALTLTGVHLAGNQAGAGGGVSLLSADGVFTACTVSGNATTGSGGGIFYQGSGRLLRVVNSTVSGNAAGGSGGGLFNGSFGAESVLEVVNSTVANNRSVSSGGGIRTDANGTATTRLRSSIIAGNAPDNLAAQSSGGGTATFATLGFNLSDNYNGALALLIQDRTGPARLGPLSLHGGTMPTHALLGGSPALDAGDASGATTDQRGLARIFDAPGVSGISDDADIGAVEMRPIFVDNAADTGAGSLRQALTDANANGNTTLDDLLFTPSVFDTAQTIALATALPDLGTSVALHGPAANLLTVRRAANAGTNFRVFTIPGGVPGGVAISGMTITGGNAGSSGFGGGIDSESLLTLTNVHLTGNTAGFGGGGVGLGFADGVFTNCAFSNNSITVANGSGGGIDFQGSGGRTLRVINSTVSGNQSAGGGGINHVSTSGDSRLEVTNGTVANNTAAGSGGGIRTITVNAGSTATTTLRNTIVAGNSPTNLATATFSGGGAATFGTRGFNLSDNYNGAFTPAGTDLTAPPRLAPLSLAGGPTPTHALLGGSPALDAGNATGATTDQRGLARIFDAPGVGAASDGADIGAVEMRPLFVDNAADTGTGSLRAAVTAANANGAALDDILFQGVLFDTPQTIALASALPDLAGSLALHGPGAHRMTVRRAENAGTDFRVFTAPAGLPDGFALSGLTVTGGNAGGAFGGGIESSSPLTLTNVQVTGNAAGGGGGGGVVLGASGVFTGCTFSLNTASQGGGINFFGDGGRILRVVNCTVSGNTVSGGAGGGILNVSFDGNSRLEVVGSTIANNTAGVGGGMSTDAVNAGANAATTLLGSIIANNTPNNLTRQNFSGGTTEVTSQGFNLASDNGGGFLTGPGDALNADPLLAPLLDYGGPTPTRALKPGSPARNTAATSVRVADQRGFPVVGVPDKGAYEAGTLTNFNAYIWETLPANATDAQRAAGFDFDGDGPVNFDEFLARTDAANAGSVLRLRVLSMSAGAVTVRLPTVAGRFYRFETSTDLRTWTPAPNAPLAGTGGEVEVIIGGVFTGQTRGFVRALVGD